MIPYYSIELIDLDFKKISFIYLSNYWQQRFTEECDRLREQISQLQGEYDEQSRSFSDRLEIAATQNSEYLQVFNLKKTFHQRKKFHLKLYFSF